MLRIDSHLDVAPCIFDLQRRRHGVLEVKHGEFPEYNQRGSVITPGRLVLGSERAEANLAPLNLNVRAPLAGFLGGTNPLETAGQPMRRLTHVAHVPVGRAYAQVQPPVVEGVVVCVVNEGFRSAKNAEDQSVHTDRLPIWARRARCISRSVQEPSERMDGWEIARVNNGFSTPTYVHSDGSVLKHAGWVRRGSWESLCTRNSGPRHNSPRHKTLRPSLEPARLRRMKPAKP